MTPFALLLAAAALAQTAPAADPQAPLAAAPPPAAAVAPAAASDLPAGAPSDDYGFVAWCRGALGGHMELYKAVKPEMQRVEAEKAARENAKLSGAALAAAKAKEAAEARQADTEDAEQLKAGRDYVALYAKAMDAAEASGPDNLRIRGEAAAADGYRIWAAARAAGSRDRMWSWLMWELPARCETAAKRLQANAGLFGGAFKGDAPAPATSAAPGPATAETAAPAPDAPAASPAPTPNG